MKCIQTTYLSFQDCLKLLNFRIYFAASLNSIRIIERSALSVLLVRKRLLVCGRQHTNIIVKSSLVTPTHNFLHFQKCHLLLKCHLHSTFPYTFQEHIYDQFSGLKPVIVNIEIILKSQPSQFLSIWAPSLKNLQCYTPCYQ